QARRLDPLRRHPLYPALQLRYRLAGSVLQHVFAVQARPLVSGLSRQAGPGTQVRLQDSARSVSFRSRRPGLPTTRTPLAGLWHLRLALSMSDGSASQNALRWAAFRCAELHFVALNCVSLRVLHWIALGCALRGGICAQSIWPIPRAKPAAASARTPACLP